MKNISEALSKSIIKKLEKHNAYYIGVPYAVYGFNPHYIRTKDNWAVEIFNEKEKDDAIKKKYKGEIYKILFEYKDYNDLRKKIEKDVKLDDDEESKIEIIYPL